MTRGDAETVTGAGRAHSPEEASNLIASKFRVAEPRFTVNTLKLSRPLGGRAFGGKPAAA